MDDKGVKGCEGVDDKGYEGVDDKGVNGCEGVDDKGVKGWTTRV